MVLRASVYTRVTRYVSPPSSFFQSCPIWIFRTLMGTSDCRYPGQKCQLPIRRGSFAPLAALPTASCGQTGWQETFFCHPGILLLEWFFPPIVDAPGVYTRGSWGGQ